MCPHCNGNLTNLKRLAANLEAKECSSCGGLWIPGYSYAKFLELRVPFPTEAERAKAQTDEVPDSEPGKTCPDCGKAVVGRRIGHGIPNYVERCDNCFGVWLDKGEWESLTAKGLEDKIYHIFSHYWQNAVKKQGEFDAETKKLREILDPERAEVVVEFRRWLAKQPDKAEILPYLF